MQVSHEVWFKKQSTADIIGSVTKIYLHSPFSMTAYATEAEKLNTGKAILDLGKTTWYSLCQRDDRVYPLEGQGF